MCSWGVSVSPQIVSNVPNFVMSCWCWGGIVRPREIGREKGNSLYFSLNLVVTLSCFLKQIVCYFKKINFPHQLQGHMFTLHLLVMFPWVSASKSLSVFTKTETKTILKSQKGLSKHTENMFKQCPNDVGCCLGHCPFNSQL